MKFCRIRILASAFLASFLVFGSSINAKADEWKQDGIGWWCQREDGTYPTSTWYENSDGSWYFLDERGYMISNCYQCVDGSIYAFGYDGKWTGTVFSDISQGIWAGNHYSNEWSGFCLNVPEGYQVMSASDTGTIGTAQTLVEFVIRIPDGSDSAVELEYADAYDFPNGLATTPELVAMAHSLQLVSQGYMIDDLSDVVLGGREYVKLSASILGGVIKRDMYCRKVGEHYFECLSAVYWLASQPEMETLLANIY